MALITSAASGNFSAGATWTGGVVPGVGDEARASTGHTVTIDVNTTCDEISNAGTGKFVFANSVTLTANVTFKGTTTGTNLLELTSTNSAAIVGEITHANNVATTAAVNHLGTGTLTVTGNIIGSSGAIIGGRNAVINNNTGTINVTGTILGSSGPPGALVNASTGEINLTGTTTSGSGTGSPLQNNSTGTFTVVGNLIASNAAPAFASASTSATNVLRGNFQSSAQGVLPIYAQKVILGSAPSQNEFVFSVDGISTTATFFTADALPGVPLESDVRSGTVYGASNELTGTCAVPAAASVAFGVPVDNTTGTAALEPSDIAAAVWDRVLTGATHNIPSSAGRRLRILDDERIITDGQVQGAGTNTVTLEPITSLCIGQTVVVTDQTTGNKQVRFILSFDSATNVATVDTQWCDIPTVGDEYQLTTVRSPLIARNDYPSGTIGAEIDEMYLIQGLKDGETLTVTPTSRTAGAIAQTIGGDGTTTTTVSRD
jgi:hypothetical protein